MSPDPRTQRDTFVSRLEEAGLGLQRFVNVKEGEKRSTQTRQELSDYYTPDELPPGNYGIEGGQAEIEDGPWLVNVDIDDYNEESQNEALEAILDLPETLTVASPHTDGETGGHKFYAVTGDVMEETAKLTTNEGVNNLAPSWGEIRFKNQYVVGPGSQINGETCDKDWCDNCATEDGGYYRISEDTEIAEIHVDELVDAVTVDPAYPQEEESESLSDYPTKTKKSGVPDDVVGENAGEEAGPGEEFEPPEYDTEVSDAVIEEFFDRNPKGDKLRKLYNGNLEGTEYENDTSEADVWFAHEVDEYIGHGNLARVASVLDKSDLPKWNERTRKYPSYRATVLERLGNSENYKELITDDDIEHGHVIEDRETAVTVETATFPDCDFVLTKPPRSGGSHWILKNYIRKIEREQEGGLLVTAPRHSILNQHVETVKDQMNDVGRGGIVHLKGKTKLCRDHDHSTDDTCPGLPGEDQSERERVERQAKDAVVKYKVVKPEHAPADICRHRFIKEAAKFATVVLTVPQLQEDVLEGREPDDLYKFVDEEQALDHFLPPSVGIADITLEQDTDGTWSIEQRNRHIESYESTLAQIAEEAEEQYQERLEEQESANHSMWEKLAIDAHEAAEEMMDALSTEGLPPNLEQAKQILYERLLEIDFPNPRHSPDATYDKFQEWAEQYYHTNDGDGDIVNFLTAMTFEYDDRPFDFKDVGDNKSKLRLIGNKEQRPFYADKFSRFKQIGMVAGPEGERFLDSVSADTKVIEISHFEYGDHYHVITVGDKEEDDEESEEDDEEEDDDSSSGSKRSHRRKVANISRELNRRQKPHMAVTGTEEQAVEHDASLTKGAGQVIRDPESPTKVLIESCTTGQTVTIYENSVVSRGIDAPQFDITTVVNSGFATPYWEAKAKHGFNNDDVPWEEYVEAKEVEQRLKSREMTNAAFRACPTYQFREEGVSASKFIVIAEDDLPSLMYLDNRVIGEWGDADEVVELLDVLTSDGAFEARLTDLLNELDGNEKELAMVRRQETICEKVLDKPRYDAGQVEEWLDKDYITDTDRLGRVEDAVRSFDGPATTSDVADKVRGVERGGVSANLEVLRERGLVEKEKQQSEGPGEPTVYWTTQ